MSYKPIEEYGIVGDLHTVALVGTDGSIDWCCMPNFDSPSVFAAILDDKKGGHFKVSGVDVGVRRQFYHPETNVLTTYFSSSDGVALVEDFMPLETVPDSEGGRHYQVIIRRISGVRGTRRMRLECFPAFNYARSSHRIARTEHGPVFEAESGERLGLSMPFEYDVQEGGVVAEFDVSAGDSYCVTAGLLNGGGNAWLGMSDEAAQRMRDETIAYWRGWLSRCTYRGRWRETVYRSALTLKLLTFAPTGAIVAAPTCSLPELIGGGRNWDYRYTWLRDAAFTLYGLMRIGLTGEAREFMRWLEARTGELSEEGTPQIMYRLDGQHTIDELTLDHLDGYRGSRPVRVGNSAHHQLQLDIYGELMDSIYLYNKYGSPISYDLWKQLRRILDWVAANWMLPDEGIWEVRGGRQQFVFSKLMCWVALDRGLRLANVRSFPAPRTSG